MKKFIVPFVSLVALFLINGCSTKFKIAAPYKNITVVYGLLDQADTAHYVRIQKAFLDENKSALTMAQTADSNFYSTLNVRVKRFDFLGNFVDSIKLNRVDLTLEGYPKPTGVFFNSPNYAYKFTNALDPNLIYQLMITNPSGETDSVAAPVIQDNNKTSFYIDVIDNTNLNLQKMDFSSTKASKDFSVSPNYTPVNNFSFYGVTTPVGIEQLIIRFFWEDSNDVTKVLTQDSADFNIGYQQLNGSAQQYGVSDVSLYNFLQSALGTAPANTFRLLGVVRILVYMGTTDYYNYYQTTLTQGTGLTASEIEPIATNLKGANVLGLFTSKGGRSGLITMSYSTIDSLEQSPLLSQAKIAGTAYH